MDLSLSISLLCFILSFFIYLFLRRSSSSHKLPPGNSGWPLIGETIRWVSAGRKGQPERFILDRMAKFSPLAFRTHLLGQPTAILGGPEGNKFIFSNENKYVRLWCPRVFDRVILGSSAKTTVAEETASMKKMFPNFLNPDASADYIGIIDETARRHFSEKWENEERVTVFPLAKQYTFQLACQLFLSINDPKQIAELFKPFMATKRGFDTIPVNLPGTATSRAMKASDEIRRMIVSIIRQRKSDIAQGKVSPKQDFLSDMLSDIKGGNENDTHATETSIAGKILISLIAGYDTVSITCTFVVMYLAELPEIYDAVRKEQIEIAKSKAPGELLNAENLGKMKYSWNVVCEVLRLVPPAQGSFREALTDFTYKGFSIPKGWKLYWDVNGTHRNPEYFPEPEKFDPSRFEESKSNIPQYAYVPFGGGARKCPGKEYAKLQILVFMHHLVNNFKWEKMVPDEKMVVDPMPFPAKNLPIRLFSHKA